MEKNDNKEKIILALIAIVIIAIAAIAVIVMHFKMKEITTSNFKKENSIEDEAVADGVGEANPNEIVEIPVRELNNSVEYINVKQCVDKYMSLLNYIGVTENNKTNEIYKLLDKQYIDEFGITVENLEQKIPKGNFTFNIDQIYVKDEEETLVINYWVIGDLIDNINKKAMNYQLIIRVDLETNAFSFIPYDYLQKYQPGEEGLKIKNNSIETNDYNEFPMNQFTEDKIANLLFNNFRLNLIYNKNKAYERMNQEYVNARFDTVQEMQQYINKLDVTNSTVVSYNVGKYDDNNTTYCVIDQNENVFVFNTRSLQDYTVMLDTYTFNIDENFITPKNDNETTEKAMRILNKMESAVNDQNYKYLFDRLNQEFRTDKYQTKEALGNYLQAMLYEKNTFSLKGYTNTIENNGVVIINADVYEKKNRNTNASRMEPIEAGHSEKKTISFIIQMKDDSNFEYSFSIESEE